MTATALIAVGANLGDRAGTIRSAVVALCTSHPVSITAASKLYVTAPVGGPPGQPEYLNAAISVDTLLSPVDLLVALQDIELLHGRDRTVRNAPRTLDLDLLFYDDRVYRSDHLELPHPRLHLRRFVLQPLVDIAPNLIHPTLGLSIASLLRRLPDGPAVSVFAHAGWISPLHEFGPMDSPADGDCQSARRR